VSRAIQRENAVPHLVGELPPLRDTTALRELVERAVRQAGNPSKLAHALQVTQSHVSRLRQGSCGLSVTLMLRLADFLDEDGVAILRICGHVRIADLFERLQRGSPQRPRHLLYDAIDRLSAADRAMVSAFVNRLLIDSTPPSPLPVPDPQTRSWR
jgi:plasmid maintenance system antidote protein VapI